MVLFPFTDIIIENNCFDFQKLENVDISKWEYQQGPLYGFKDYKDYINKQQGNVCLLCGESHIEHHHHIIPRSENGSDTVANIAGLCNHCHELVHKNPDIRAILIQKKAGCKKKYEISLLNSCVQRIIDELSKLKPTTCCTGYDTAELRKALNLQKDHCIDAYCISLYNKQDIVDGPLTYELPIPCKIEHFKKKNNSNIQKVGSRQYFYNGKLVATNRHKAMGQETPSLEEYMSAYVEEHGQKEADRHFHELVVKPAKRIYNNHKQVEQKHIKTSPAFKCGDVVKIKKKGQKVKVITVCCVRSSRNTVSDGSSIETSFKYCTAIRRKSLEFVNPKP